MMTRDKHYQPLLVLTALLLAQNAAGVTLGFLEEDYAVTEGGNFTATVTKDDMANDAPIELSILPMTFAEFEASGRVLPSEIQDITSTLTPAQSGDFSSLPISVTIPPSPGFISQAVLVSITVDDSINEAMEDYLIVIEVGSIVPANETVNFVREGVALVRVRDNDPITIEFTQGSYMVAEVNGTVNDVALRKMDGVQSEQNITVLLNYVSLTGPGSATAGVDYIDPGQLPVLFLPSEAMITIPVVILEDTDPEPDESFTLQITLPLDPPSGVLTGLSSSTVIITDNDRVTHEVGFLQSTYTVLEGDSVDITYGILTDPNLLLSTEFAVLNLEVLPDTATADDYTFDMATLMGFVDRNAPVGILMINAEMDSIIEGTETLTLRVNLSTVDGNFIVPQPNSQATVFIVEPGSSLATTVSPTPSTTPSVSSPTPSPSQTLSTSTGIPPSPTPDPITPTTTPPTTPPTTLGMGGDPHYSILLPSGQQLCYSVQGEPDFAFNLISNKLLHMNALFIQDSKREEITWIGELGVVVRDGPKKKANSTALRFCASGHMVCIGDKIKLHASGVEKLTFSGGKLSIDEREEGGDKERPEVLVDFPDIGISFTVRFVRGRHLDMVWNKVDTRMGKSHGMIGQFFRKNVKIDEPRRLLLLPGGMEPVPVMRKPVWAFMERETTGDEQLCWVAMNPGYQGKKLLQGHYRDYLVDDVLSSSFKFKPKKH